ncbi:MAG: maltose alpha-D-glucosyltransferase [Proteobacteria bacterium]|nr:maltose alpha-D-glucosyltransferase [Pseudomonadota bacterium]
MSRRRPRQEPESEPQWYRDAVIYELHVRAFCDSNADGIGDFQGLISKLDYLRDLGVTAIWLLPFYPSPLRDDGYDIADYTSVNPAHGTLSDFKRFLREAHARGLRVITELVINHTSSEHPWFQRAREAPPGSRERNFYVWSDTAERYSDTRIIFKDFETSNWTWDPVAKAYYWHRFYSHQPDLNFDSPQVHRSLLKIVDFWMDMGVDGMRLDAVPYLYEREGTNCENLAETHAFLKELRRHIDGKYKDRMLLAEANQWPEDSAAYFGNGDECHMNFHFPLMPRMFMALHLEDRFPLVDILDQTPAIPENCQWAIFLRNHDELTLEMVTDEDRDYMWRVYAEDRQARINLGIRRRLAPLLRARRKIELLNGLLFSLPGTPVVYYGDEIGMGDNIYMGDRDGVRTPMQWSPDRNAGFSRANPQRLYLPVIIDSEYHYEAVNVETALGNPSSLLWWMKRMITLRTRHAAFGRGAFKLLRPNNNKVFAFVRSYEQERILVVANLARFCQHVELDLADYAGSVPEELFGRTPFPAISEGPYSLSLSPHAFFWFQLTEPSAPATGGGDVPELRDVGELKVLLERPGRGRLEGLLTQHVTRQRWFRSKARRIRNVQVVDEAAVGRASLLVLLQVDFYQGSSEIYLLPLGICSGAEAAGVLKAHPAAVLAKAGKDEDLSNEAASIVCEASLIEDFARQLLAVMASRRGLKTGKGRLVGWVQQGTETAREAARSTPRSMGVEQTNTSIAFGEVAILKLQRLIEPGVNADVEVVRFLNESTTFRQAPEVLGTLQYETQKKEPALVGALQRFIPNRGDAWTFTLEVIQRYYEQALAQPVDVKAEFPEGGLVKRALETPPKVMEETLGPYVPLVRLLAERTAELHVALGSRRRDPSFGPEAFSELYQRSMYQSARSRLAASMDSLRSNVNSLSDADRDRANGLLSRSDAIDHKLRAIAAGRIAAQRIRCHGDYHLGQVLYTGKDFVIIDFEGEPARSITERRFKRSALRDVAGMIRSFHYAAETALRECQETETEMQRLGAWSRAWAEWVSALFLGTYLDRAKASPGVPAREEDTGRLLEFYLLEKCIYELGYELNHRPDWVCIPLSGLEQLLAQGAVQG